MGGRGASSGISVDGKKYETEYQTVYQSGNIKFVRQRNDQPIRIPMETMTSGRIYVTTGKNDTLKSISYYDHHNKRHKQVDLDHFHKIDGKREKPHTHKGYLHNEKGDYTLSAKEMKMVDRVFKIWEYYKNKKKKT